MTITVSATSITFNDGSVQITAPSLPLTLYQIGTYVTGRPQDVVSYPVNHILSGGVLFNTSPSGVWSNAQCPPIWAGAGQVLINVGTWRCISPAFALAGTGRAGLWIRIA
jgi:hypothetical protein